MCKPEKTFPCLVCMTGDATPLAGGLFWRQVFFLRSFHVNQKSFMVGIFNNPNPLDGGKLMGVMQSIMRTCREHIQFGSNYGQAAFSNRRNRAEHIHLFMNLLFVPYSESTYSYF